MNKKNLILFGVLVLLLAVAYIYQGPYQNWKETKGEANQLLSGVKVENVDKVEINKPNATSTISMAIDDQGWKLA